MSTNGGRLAGKVALITGAASGFGRAAAVRFTAEGAVVGCADVDLDGAEETATLITEMGGRAVPIQADVASGADCERMADTTAGEFGRLDVLFANAGVAGVGSAVSTSEADWQRVLDINLKGVWLSAKYALPYMLEQGAGSIVNTASVGGLVGVGEILPYSAAKGGVIAMTKQMAFDFSPRGIRVNAICPGTVLTPLVTATYEERAAGEVDPGAAADEALQRMTQKYPIGRVGTTDDVANMALFLASDEAQWITGSALTVDGGYTAL
ncbi:MULTISPECIES: SDR family NAD(P)-dependent oxidoreductase [Prauserella salsuginis group]|uniref:NAD(P)-dependent dehydrogenase (Short-subunit alcohol dehydrogenase family) n=2 Tax=Prauserella salsuginis group TaxID=2893672 RepID=A0A839XW01_9PSEU|nr:MULTISPECIES: glucose 1-dehydrogenase [Prauserella salsuginis group]MBB3664693.1 NAD(P)-dependent dehydrogenase (short-subunit alcohol dehydrogenase family) [Prauserella sediminis]MCR3722159.1 NAD(P)-dependent dehydrogenase, short-chain alcohol dehydrogenase family [Prauserella flava]MCR3736157.1 NAD(P)-dependent dehydrogenase, short-chain alcohol dehydrogenase family [Prauserella salsuginis]